MREIQGFGYDPYDNMMKLAFFDELEKIEKQAGLGSAILKALGAGGKAAKPTAKRAVTQTVKRTANPMASKGVPASWTANLQRSVPDRARAINYQLRQAGSAY